ncbi:MAG TPA: phosphotransferase [Thermomicrobiales bacterium]|jgi:aminoglycoside phosphotransferase (APT) family kinase protein|nr:phosphotransferase [Thermomicrobiales bacterium]
MADHLDPVALLAELGIGDVTTVTPVTGGMSGAWLWRVGRGWARDLLLRAQPETDDTTFRREVSGQRAAHGAGIPTPAIIAAARVGNPSIPVIVMEWASGRTALDVIAGPVAGDAVPLAVALGEQSGRLMARLHAIPVPADLVEDDRLDYWLQGLDDGLRQRVAGPGSAKCVLHFDFHPMNLLVDEGEISTLLDWTNVLVGDPRLDLGRSYACLQLGASIRADRIDRALVDGFWRGLVTGYGLQAMTLDQLAPFLAAGLHAMIEDRRRHPMNEAMFDAVTELATERQAWIGLAERSLT